MPNAADLHTYGPFRFIPDWFVFLELREALMPVAAAADPRDLQADGPFEPTDLQADGPSGPQTERERVRRDLRADGPFQLPLDWFVSLELRNASMPVAAAAGQRKTVFPDLRTYGPFQSTPDRFVEVRKA